MCVSFKLLSFDLVYSSSKSYQKSQTQTGNSSGEREEESGEVGREVRGAVRADRETEG